jgi:diguanylate cyclase (GGDEF)-like protein
MMWPAVGIFILGVWTRWTWALVASVLVALWMVWNAQQMSPWMLATQVLLILLLPALLWHVEVMHDRWEERYHHDSAMVKEHMQVVQASVTMAQHQRDLLAYEISRLVELYRVTKDTAGEVHFEGFFQSLTAVLSTIMSFDSCWLMLTAQEAESDALRCTELWLSHMKSGEVHMDRVTSPPSWQQALLQFVSCDSTSHQIRDGQAPWIRSGQDATQPALLDVTWIPLIVQGKVLGVLVCEGLSPEEFGRAQVIAHQVALQLQRILLYQHLEQLAVTDGLTGLAVRRYFEECLDDELARARRRNLPLSLVMGDIDRFKHLNDTYGHLVGDEVLKRVAGVLKANVREIDLVGRFGGEEFILVLVDTGVVDAHRVADRIRQAIAEETIYAYDETVQVTISFGIAMCPDHGSAAELLIECADQALYQAKAAGRNTVVDYVQTG